MPDLSGINNNTAIVRRTTFHDATIDTENLNETIHITNHGQNENLILRNIPMIAFFTTYHLHSTMITDLNIPYEFNTPEGIRGSVEYVTLGKYRIDCRNHPEITRCYIQLTEYNFYVFIQHITNVLRLRFDPDQLLTRMIEHY